jgi:nitroimidazol reductase NimA-like FMN-containing flavoprotein (pyridoxamine 5'-phosphate oxidase superfamily)
VNIDDEPVLETGGSADSETRDPGFPIERNIQSLMASQPYGVLCTHGEGHSYGSMVAHACTSDLRTVVFATPVTTRKFRLLTEHDKVALVVDNRPEKQARMMEVEAITITGKAREVEDTSERETWSRMLLERHPQLRSFLASDTSAIFRIEVIRIFHVTRFQEVRQWIPSRD